MPNCADIDMDQNGYSGPHWIDVNNLVAEYPLFEEPRAGWQPYEKEQEYIVMLVGEAGWNQAKTRQKSNSLFRYKGEQASFHRQLWTITNIVLEEGKARSRVSLVPGTSRSVSTVDCLGLGDDKVIREAFHGFLQSTIQGKLRDLELFGNRKRPRSRLPSRYEQRRKRCHSPGRQT